MSAPYAQGFTTQPNELVRVPLTIHGSLPAWLRGTLIRNGPGQFEVGKTPIAHWFDGLAMLHSFEITDEGAFYTNRFIRSNAFYRDTGNEKINYLGFAQDPCRALFKKVMALFFEAEPGNNTVVNLIRLGERYVAMTEFPMTVEFDPKTLATLGVLEYDDKVDAISATAHPHYDATRGVGINMMTHYGRKTAYEIYALTDTTRRKLGEVLAGSTSYIHSFATTPRYAIVAQFSHRLGNPMSLIFSGKPFIQNFAFDTQQDTIFSVIALDTGEVVANVPADAFFAFHHINAYEEGDALIVDIAAYNDAALIDQLYIEAVSEGYAVDFGEVRRYHVPLSGGRATYTRIGTTNIELPRINYRYNGLPYQTVYAVSTRDDQPSFINQLVRLELASGQTTFWQEDHTFPSEPVFIAAPDATSENDGVVLSVVLDADKSTSFLLVLDAATFTELARAELPQHVPFGFHGAFFRSPA